MFMFSQPSCRLWALASLLVLGYAFVASQQASAQTAQRRPGNPNRGASRGFPGTGGFKPNPGGTGGGFTPYPGNGNPNFGQGGHPSLGQGGHPSLGTGGNSRLRTGGSRQRVTH